MNKNRLEAFSDGVIAIIITIMVLELKPPHGTSAVDVVEMLPSWLRYALSFVYVGIYWVNHHALLDRVSKVDGAVLWANLHLLFWMSLIPYVTAWAGENPLAAVPGALYGAVLLLCSISFLLLSWRLDVETGHAVSWGSRKNRLSIALYALAIGLSLWYAPFGAAVHVLLALLWLMPERAGTPGQARRSAVKAANSHDRNPSSSV